MSDRPLSSIEQVNGTLDVIHAEARGRLLPPRPTWVAYAATFQSAPRPRVPRNGHG